MQREVFLLITEHQCEPELFIPCCVFSVYSDLFNQTWCLNNRVYEGKALVPLYLIWMKGFLCSTEMKEEEEEEEAGGGRRRRSMLRFLLT